VSFHHDFAEWERFSRPEGCPVCQNWPEPADHVTIREFPTSWLIAHPRVCLRGTCCLLLKPHAVELYDLDEADLLGFMKEAQVCARALKAVTGAVKINYEIHGNTIPHLHMHLFPRRVRGRHEGSSGCGRGPRRGGAWSVTLRAVDFLPRKEVA